MKKLVEDAASKVEEAAQKVAAEVAKRAFKRTAQSKLDSAKSYLNRMLGDDSEPKAPPPRSLLEKVFGAEPQREEVAGETSFFGKLFGDSPEDEALSRSEPRAEKPAEPSLTERREALDARARAKVEGQRKLEREVEDELEALRERVRKK